MVADSCGITIAEVVSANSNTAKRYKAGRFKLVIFESPVIQLQIVLTSLWREQEGEYLFDPGGPGALVVFRAFGLQILEIPSGLPTLFD
jgi:hypothetical protein